MSLGEYGHYILKEGEGFERPIEGAVVKVGLMGKLSDGTVFIKKGHEEELFEFMTGEEQVLEGLDRAVMTMKKGGGQELATVPANSTVYYEVDLLSFVKANKYVEYDSSFGEEEKKQAMVLKVSCNLNNAACKLKLKDKQAEKLCTKVLQLESRNVKALYRRAQAYINMTDLYLAEIDIKKALEIDPDNRDVKVEYRTLKEKLKEYKEAKFYGNMFARMSKLEEIEAFLNKRSIPGCYECI